MTNTTTNTANTNSTSDDNAPVIDGNTTNMTLPTDSDDTPTTNNINAIDVCTPMEKKKVGKVIAIEDAQAPLINSLVFSKIWKNAPTF